MSDDVSLGEIELVQEHILDAIVKTKEPTTLSSEEQDRLLAQACSEACGILGRWVGSSAWEGLRPKARGPIADITPDLQEIRSFLVRLSPALSRMSERRRSVAGIKEIGDQKVDIDDLIKRAESTGRRHRRFDREQLYAEATERIKGLQSSVCAIAADFAKGTRNRARLRAAARSVLKTVGSFLFGAALIAVGMTQQAVAHDMSAAVHEGVSVVLVHQAAHAAQPTVRVAPPQVGPHLGPRIG